MHIKKEKSSTDDSSRLIDSLYFDSNMDFFKGCLNETDGSLSNYTTDEVWNLIKLESPFDNTSCTVYYGNNGLNNYGNTPVSCY